MTTAKEVLVDQGITVAYARMVKAENMAKQYANLLRSAQDMRPILLKQYGAVPECVLEFCNKARHAVDIGGDNG